MKKYKWLIILAVIAVVIAGYIYAKPRIKAKKIEFTYTALERGDIEADISSMGTLEAINTVEVGTQISGTITKIHTDYNDLVQEGQLLAEMDVKLLNTALLNAQANRAVIEAQLSQAKDEFERNQMLFQKKVITEKEYKDSKYVYEQILSSKKAAEANVNTAKVNLEYARITSPISGTVTERSVEEGQTVAASFATPTMFIIAEDLSKMQILADVDESDIGYILNGMSARFKVQTYPEKDFYGTVSQIRLQPITINNVVNYQVVVDVNNDQGLLLPGMTASLDFITERAQNVLLVNNSALRFRPTETMLKEIKPVLVEYAKKVLPDSLQSEFNKAINDEEIYTPTNFKKNLPSNINGFFFKNSKDKLDFKFIEIGIITGLQSEIKIFLDDEGLPDGTRVINGIKSK
jgi:HlyD family secretion protein